ncbi:methyltransferase [Saccharothrix longispora]|uniref:SAM-dependent methyltransferase n=1 Tax=Saccharothrix longispora TaxID=33920 RepID=A0ABU1PTI6_9PSEU|nr:methyltransferase [Saccharothrix longispora]MDR6593424.1 SAM-dependent methyltransferase [Saccharothrix longispora]
MSPEQTAEQTAELIALLADHPWIASAVQDGPRVRVRPTRAATAMRPSPGPLVLEHLEHWGEVYDFTYSTGAARPVGEPDFSGWRSSETGEPFPVEHMTDWVERTVDLVLAARPRWVLELGCGTGLLAHRLRPHLAGYVGTDVAQSAVDRLAAEADPSCAYVRAAAHEVASPGVLAALARAGFPAEGPDCVLVNSVTQHFPHVEYLAAVVVDALRLLAPGGSLVIGDVRHAGLLEAHCRRVEAAVDPDPATLDERARSRAERDDELNFDPATLAAAAAGAGRPVRVSVHPKALRADTELTRYRFDAVLRVDTSTTARPVDVPWSGTADLVGAVDAGPPVRVTGIPNRLLSPAPGGVTARELRDALVGRDAAVLLDVRDPALLEVVAPASAAPAPAALVAAGPARAHEPFTAFLARRLGEVARVAARRNGLPAPVVTVDADPLADAARAADAAIGADDARRLPAFLRDLDRVALLAMAATLGQAGAEGTAEEVADALRAAPRHRWIVRRWLAALVEEGMVAHDGRTYRDVLAVSRAELEDAVRDIDRARRGMGYPPELTRFFQSATRYLPELLRDEVALQSLLFADGETGTAEGAYRDNPVNRYANAAVAHLVRAHADTPPAGRPLRVLEVGAGVGGTTADVLAALAGVPLDYLFTDVSRFFLLDAEERFAGVDGLRFGTFDIDDDPTGQGVGAGELDVVLGANVLHNARDLGATLRGLRDLLVPGGLLVFVDTTREIRQLLTSMQFLMSARAGREPAGSGDFRAGTDRIFPTEAEWTTELLVAGFEPVGCLPPPDHALRPIGVQVFAAVRPSS